MARKQTRPAGSDQSASEPGSERPDIAWPLADAKARFSELVDTVEREGPQVISKHGREVVVVVPIDEWRRKSKRQGSFAEFMATSPLRGAELELERERSDSAHRDVVL
ncbi:type II toxin-antitoxin system Phd/YefM family antitoxin [Nocardia sp. XZ_19_385]|uniref:type II toxin-antitoxin system Phd/YefM family antitoxin n=1 Tax=Nocardia sp. XZ_19_385 TaxID=2769488 RepID=UPI00188F1E6D|nr:type II toxin-antitoxin system Phd/YefM family antitoxin [Nocardia sp. XZ_19_385]